MTTGALATGLSNVLTTLPDTVIVPDVPVGELESLLHPGTKTSTKASTPASMQTVRRRVRDMKPPFTLVDEATSIVVSL